MRLATISYAIHGLVRNMTNSTTSVKEVQIAIEILEIFAVNITASEKSKLELSHEIEYLRNLLDTIRTNLRHKLRFAIMNRATEDEQEKITEEMRGYKRFTYVVGDKKFNNVEEWLKTDLE